MRVDVKTTESAKKMRAKNLAREVLSKITILEAKCSRLEKQCQKLRSDLDSNTDDIEEVNDQLPVLNKHLDTFEETQRKINSFHGEKLERLCDMVDNAEGRAILAIALAFLSLMVAGITAVMAIRMGARV